MLDYRWSHNPPTYWRTVSPNWYRTHTVQKFSLQSSWITGACHYTRCMSLDTSFLLLFLFFLFFCFWSVPLSFIYCFCSFLLFHSVLISSFCILSFIVFFFSSLLLLFVYFIFLSLCLRPFIWLSVRIYFKLQFLRFFSYFYSSLEDISSQQNSWQMQKQPLSRFFFPICVFDLIFPFFPFSFFLIFLTNSSIVLYLLPSAS